MNFRRVYQIFWCKSLTFNETTSHQHHEIRQETLSPFTHHTKRIASTKSANTKRGWCRMLPTSECDFDNLKIELSSANLDLIIEKTKLLR